MSTEQGRLQTPAAPRSPWQRVYAWAHHRRRLHYRRHAQRLPVPVWSIGNLHWGGSGKTPLIAAVADHLQQAGRTVAVLSRGYRRRSRGIRIVSRGGGLLVPVEEAGDEPSMLAESTEGVAIVVGSDRYACGLTALSQLERRPDILLLDDGFSHLRLARDLDILTFPCSDPFGGGRLLPSGRLREPLSSAAAADAVVLTGVPDDDSRLGSSLAVALEPFGFEGPGFASRIVAEVLPTTAKPVTALLVTGIARPERVAGTARDLGLEVRGELRFPDHHHYPPRSLERITAEFGRLHVDHVLTTSKDKLKLADRLALPLVELRIRAQPQTSFWQWIDQRASISNSGSPPSTD